MKGLSLFYLLADIVQERRGERTSPNVSSQKFHTKLEFDACMPYVGLREYRMRGNRCTNSRDLCECFGGRRCPPQ
jgi:hypothetical protein